MAPKTKTVDDPFRDDEWGMPDAVDVKTESEEMPEASTEDKPAFLKPNHCGAATTGTMELVRVTSETSEFSDVILIVKLRNRSFRLGLKLFSEDYKSLAKRFGKKRADWHGEIRYKVMPHRGNPNGYVAIR